MILSNIMGLDNMEQKENKKNKAVELGVVTESLSSVKIYKAAGNEIRYEVKVYNADPQKAMRTATDIMDKLNKKYKVKE